MDIVLIFGLIAICFVILLLYVSRNEKKDKKNDMLIANIRFHTVK